MILMVYVYDINMIICYNASSQQDKMNVIESETTALYQQNTYMFVYRSFLYITFLIIMFFLGICCLMCHCQSHLLEMLVVYQESV